MKTLEAVKKGSKYHFEPLTQPLISTVARALQPERDSKLTPARKGSKVQVRWTWGYQGEEWPWHPKLLSPIDAMTFYSYTPKFFDIPSCLLDKPFIYE